MVHCRTSLYVRTCVDCRGGKPQSLTTKARKYLRGRDVFEGGYFCHDLQSLESISHGRLVSVGDNWNCMEFFHDRLFSM